MFGINDGNFMVLVNKIMILIILFNGKFLHIVVVDTQGGYMMQVVLMYVYFRVVYPAQALYSCVTCTKPETEPAGVCLACCLECHEGHDLYELYTKR